MRKIFTASTLTLLLAASTAMAEPIPFEKARWEVQGATVEFVEKDGRQAVLLQGAAAVARGIEFENGSIEFDMLYPDQRGFSGGIWRLQDERNFEQFYLRPHQSGNPDASQYQPVFNSSAAWQLYYGEGYGAPIDHRANEWVHVRIEFSDQTANVYVDSEEPVLRVGDLKHQALSGQVGVLASGFAPAWYSNFVATPGGEDFSIETTPAPPVELHSGQVREWMVSSPLSSASLAQVDQLGAEQTANLNWQPLAAEPGGVTNLARLHGLAENSDTVFARITIVAEQAQTARFRFGYSDVARVYLNDRLLYIGNNTYESRDYRYLGTIGLFDMLALPLETGRNELWIAVSEQFGGWGVMGQFDSMAGIAVSRFLSD